MKNTLEIQEIQPGIIRSFFSLADGSIIWELHRSGLTDSDVLVLLVKKNYYQHKPGIWQITFPREHKVISNVDFATAAQHALIYIYERDNPEEPDYFY